MASSGQDPTAMGGAPGALPGGPPPGLPPGLVSNPNESRQTNIIAAAVTCWAISVVFVSLRFYSRVSLMRNPVIAEDWLVVVSLVFAGAMSGTFIAQAKYGFGRHLLDTSPANYKPMKMSFRLSSWNYGFHDALTDNYLLAAPQTEWLGMVWYVASLVIIKVSICLLYLRILRFRHARYVIWGLLAAVVIFALYGLYGIFTACRPLHLYWTYPPNSTGACRPKQDWIINTSFHIATDVIMYILPLPLVLRMRAPGGQKMVLYAILALGLFVCVVSIVRLWDFDRALSSVDVTWEAASIAYWSLVETNATIIVACVMTLRPVIKRWFPRFWGSWTEPSGGRQQQNYQPGQGGGPARGTNGDPEHGGRELVTFGSAPSRAKRSRGGRHGLSDSTLRTIDDVDGPLVPHPATTCLYTTTTTTITATNSQEYNDKTADTDGESSLEEQRQRVEQHRQQLQRQRNQAWSPREPPPVHRQ
ncbi:hypothetical protein VTJ49DRAFT_4064 [Mycothermus thermophilus]|uniref:Rhodopsin domain-containing protein n=1 Tax=Humicola insolens TaxID=85995 RepID=A0ABR3V683_HUMIN